MDVTKVDRSKQRFNRNKVINTCIRMGASRRIAEKITRNVEARLYEGIETRKIYRIIRRQLRKHVPSTKHHTDLRRALCLMRSKPDFEHFVRILLMEHSYDVVPNQIVKGRCTEHEVDGIAKKDAKTYILEVKHHAHPHTPTGLDVGRIARAVFEDVTEGYEANVNDLKVDGVIIACNTKLSEHARNYADCRGIIHLGWNSPSNYGLRAMIEAKKLYPVTFLKDVNAKVRRKFELAGIVTLKELLERNNKEIHRQTDVPINVIKQMQQVTRKLLQKE